MNRRAHKSPQAASIGSLFDRLEQETQASRDKKGTGGGRGTQTDPLHPTAASRGGAQASRVASAGRPSPDASRPEERTSEDAPHPPEQHVFSVAELNGQVRRRLEEQWATIWVEGEVSDLTRAASGHCYFSLNDEGNKAQLRCVMFRPALRASPTTLRNGARVRLMGNLSLYEPRGAFQLIARRAVAAGAGDLQARFDALRKQLEAEGLLAFERKKPLPALPQRIGVVTSHAGAALHDILRVAAGRCPVRFVVADCRVQGEEAPPTMRAALRLLLAQDPAPDVIIVARGGGSAEDLWAFNDEAWVRDLAACPVPTVSGVGHEIDVTLSDLVADRRAATPSNAAELVVPDKAALQAKIDALADRFQRLAQQRLARYRRDLADAHRRLRDPRHLINTQRQSLDGQVSALHAALQRRLRAERRELVALQQRVLQRDARGQLERDRRRLAQAQHLLADAMAARLRYGRRQSELVGKRLEELGGSVLTERRRRLDSLLLRLDAMSPHKVLARGYAIVRRADTRKLVRDAQEVRAGDALDVSLSRGTLVVRVATSKSEQ